MEKPLRILEFYSGIGGMHFALSRTGVLFQVVGAFDINTSANSVYKHNFPKTNLLQKNIEGLQVNYLENLAADVWTMSPPCQPYTRQGKQEESRDARAQSFLTLLNILSTMAKPPRYLFVENVKGFECSDTRDLLVATLRACGYAYQEFLLSPTDLGVPNSRTRYYLVARVSSLGFAPTASPLMPSSCEDTVCGLDCACNGHDYHPFCIREKLRQHCNDLPRTALSEYTETIDGDDHLLTGDILLRYHTALDIAYLDSSRSCCFTKAYSRYVVGTGSVTTGHSESEVQRVYAEVAVADDDTAKLELLLSLRFRYFSPREVCNLMCFPREFSFPEETTQKQKYMLLGNSVNVFVISSLMEWFLFPEK